MTLTHVVQWTHIPGQLDRGPKTGPLAQDAAEHMARGMRRSMKPPAEVRVVCVVPVGAPLPLPFRGAHHAR